jgi:hypothetical protein
VRKGSAPVDPLPLLHGAKRFEHPGACLISWAGRFR